MTNQAIMAVYKTAHNIPAETPLYTYAAWLKMGYTVKKGEHARHRVTLHKYVPGKMDMEGNTKQAKMFGKTAYLFEMSQVEPIKVK